MIGSHDTACLLCCLLSLSACNSDDPVSAVADLNAHGYQVTITRVATHPFLARFNLKLAVSSPGGCTAMGDLFPDTGGVSRRNLYVAAFDILYVVGQFDARRFDVAHCRVELIEFRSLESNMTFVGSFDVDDAGRWTFVPAEIRSEHPFDKL